jgi:hypothetical protein
VGGWANRVVNKLNSQLLGNEGFAAKPSSSKHSLTSLFDKITDIVTDSLEDIISAQNQNSFSGGHGGDEMGFAIAKDFLKDLENEEFFAKNFRVRPVSGVTGSGNDERQSEHVSRNNLALGGAAEPTDDEDKFNKMMNLEMEEQRRKIKVMKIED